MKTKNTKSFEKFLVIWVGQLISCIGSGLTAFALAVYVYSLTGTAASVSLVTLCAFLPSVLLAPIGGVFADRFDRRLMMILGDLFSAAGLVYMLVVILNGEIILWQICLGVSISSIFVALMEPAYKATVTDLLSIEQYARASGMVQIAGSAKYLISPVIAGLLLRIADIKLILSIDIATFFITISAALWVMRSLRNTVTKDRSQQNFLQDMKEGLRTILTNKGVTVLILLISMVTFFVGILQTLLTPMMLNIANASTLGTVLTLSSTGMLLGSMVIGIVNINKNYTNMVAISLAVGGLFFALMGVSTSTFFITAAGFLFFTALPFVNTGAEVLIRRSIPDDRQGRAWGLIGIISQLGYIAAYVTAGLLADRVFTPLLMPDGGLASTVGRLIGTGSSRGMGFMFILSGIFVSVLAVFIFNSRPTRKLETVEIIA
jgi:MFS family permease